MSKTYEVSGETTEWEDILIKKGIKSKEEILLSKGLNPIDFVKKSEDEIVEKETFQQKLVLATEDELDELEESDLEDEDEKELREYRDKRLNELRVKALSCKFGEVLPINKDDWIREVTDGSSSSWVVVHLFQDSVIECQLVEEAFVILARKFRAVKFVKIRSTQAVENWPERNLPTIFCYKDGALQQQLITIKQVGGKQMKATDLEWWLAEKRIVESDLEENPRSQIENIRTFGRYTKKNEDSDSD